MIDGLVLNVPQTDTDDEWGGTERVAWERVADKLAKLERLVEDPLSGTNGLIYKMEILLGDGVTSGFFDATDITKPVLTQGTVIVNGNLNKITIGSPATTTLTATGLSTGTGTFTGALTAGSLTITTLTATSAALTGALTAGSLAATTITAASYVYTPILRNPSGVLTVSASSDVTVQASSGKVSLFGSAIGGSVEIGYSLARKVTFSGVALTPDMPSAIDLGTASLTYRNIYTDTLTTATLTATSLNGSTTNIGNVTTGLLLISGTYLRTQANNNYTLLDSVEYRISLDSIAQYFTIKNLPTIAPDSTHKAILIETTGTGRVYMST
jgi:hypothetical protein